MLETIASPHMRKPMMSWRPWYSAQLLKTISCSEANHNKDLADGMFPYGIQSRTGRHGSAVGFPEGTLEDVPNTTEKNESSHQRHNRQHNNGKVTSLGSLLGLPVELSNGIAVQKKHKTTTKLTYTGDFLVSKLAVWVLCMGNRA